MNARKIEVTGDWRTGRSVVCYCLVKLVRLGNLAQGATYKRHSGEVLCIQGLLLSDEAFGMRVIEASWQQL